MRKILFLFLAALLSFGSAAQVTPGILATLGRTNQVGEITFTYSHNQRVGTPITFTPTIPERVVVTEYRWEIFDSNTLARVALSFDALPSFADLNTIGFYDLRVTVTTLTDQSTEYIRHAFKISATRFEEEDADLVLDLSTNQNFFYSYTGQDKSGFKIAIKGVSSAGYKVEFNNMKAASMSNPVIIQTFGEAELVGNSSVVHTWWLSGDCDNIIIDGYKEDGTPGLNITNTAATGQTQLAHHDGRFTGIQYLGVTFNHNLSIDAATLAVVGRTGADSRSNNWLASNMAFYDCTFNNCGEECAYLSNNNDGLQSGNHPYQWDNPIIAFNTFNGSGRDNIQIGGAFDIEMHDNVLYNWGQQMDTGGQTNAISWNGGSAGRCYNNVGYGGKVFLNIQSGLRPWDVNGGESVPRHNYFYNNVFYSGDYTSWSGGSSEPVAVYIQNLQDSGNPGVWNNYIFNNTFAADKKGIEQYYHTNSFSSDKNTFANNVFVVASASSIGTEYNFTGTVVNAVAATTANIPNLSSAGSSFDGVTLTNGQSLLVKDQSTQSQNGYYTWTTGGTLTRHTSADTNAELQNLQVKVTGGSTQTNTLYYQSTASINIGSTNITFALRFSDQVLNNLNRIVGAESDLLFSHYTNPNSATYLKPSASASVAFAGSPTDIDSRIPELADFLYDVEGLPMAYSGNYSFGAYAGFDKRTSTFSPVDGSAATFTSPVAVGTLTMSSGTLTFEANKVGILEYVVTASNTAPSKAQIKEGLDHTGSAAILSGTVNDFGTAESKVLGGFTEGVTRYVHCFFKTVDLVEQAGVTTVSFTTTTDSTPPTISAFAISDSNRDRITFTSSEIITATTVTGFAVATPTKTITSVTINAGQTTGHYFTVSAAFEYGDAPTLAYSGGSNLKDVSLAENALANFGATAITNNIQPGPYEDVVWTSIVNATATGNDIDATGAATAVSTRKIPVNSNGNIVFFYNAVSRASVSTNAFSMVDKDNTAPTNAQMIHHVHLLSANFNVDNYQGTTYKSTTSAIQNTVTNLVLRCYIDRTTNKTTLYYGSSPDGIALPSSWTSMHTHDGTVVSDDLRAAFKGASGYGIRDAKIQADKGLID